MKTAALVILAALCLPDAARAADVVVTLTLDGRPVDRSGGGAVLRRGLVYGNAIDLTKTFDGFITLERGGSATITIGPNTGKFAPGSARAVVNAAIVRLPAAPFMRGGDLFVPLDAFITQIAAATVRSDTARRRADIRVNAAPR